MKCALFLAGLLAVACAASVKNAGEHESLSGISPHIVGGNIVPTLDSPYTVRLRLRKNGKPVRYCGGARINQYWFITAAECLDSNKYDQIQILYPVEVEDADYYHRKDFDFVSLNHVIHPDYSAETKSNNIALIMCRYCTLLPSENIVQLPRQSETNSTFSGLPAVVSSWTINNATADDQDKNNITSYNTHIVHPFLCKASYYFSTVEPEHICASSWFGKGLTKVDVGVPLVVKEDSKLTLVGIATSLSPWFRLINVPTIFTRVSSYTDWISKVTDIPLQP